MRTFSDLLAEAYASCLESVLSCCAPFPDEKPPQGLVKEIGVFGDQPGLTPRPSYEPLRPGAWASRRERAPRKSLGSLGQESFSGRCLLPYAMPTRRPQISAPSDFRHLYSESFQFPPQPNNQSPPARQRPTSFRPLELSIDTPDNSLSSILPDFDYPHPGVTPPPLAHTNRGFDSDNTTLAHQRSYSSMSFHLPRRPATGSSPSQRFDESPPQIPPRSRLRAYTSPSVEHIVERIASAMLEKERLQAEIDSIVERQSIYANSRPSTAHGLGDLEPMPSIPALPAAAPSFAERLSTERAAPPERADTPPRESAARAPPSRSSPRINGRRVDVPLAPPLPLVLRPPLRKKKSFSRVSNWLFPGEEVQHQRDISLGSITNAPKPVTGKEGFYQCAAPPAAEDRKSFDTISTMSTWTTEEDPTVPTTWSPGSSPVAKQDTSASSVGRRATFGASTSGARPQSVGVAF